MKHPVVSDDLLEAAQFSELNARFFAAHASPGRFIEHRLRGVLLAASGDPRVFEAMASGLELGKLRLGQEATPESIPEDERLRFAALEATVLFHHAAETLMRLILAIQNRPLCPWMEVTRLREPGAFRKHLSGFGDRLSTDEVRATLAWMFYGVQGGDPIPGAMSQDDWEDSLDGIVHLVALATHRVLTEDRLYNSAKHGLTALNIEAGLTLGDADTPIITKPASPALSILEMPNARHGPARWRETIHFVDTETSLVLVQFIAAQIDNLWTVARALYLNQLSGSITPMSGTGLQQVLDANDVTETDMDGIRVQTFSMDLAYRASAIQST